MCSCNIKPNHKSTILCKGLPHLAKAFFYKNIYIPIFICITTQIFARTLPESCKQNIARVQNCPDVTILNCLLCLCQLSFCLFVFSSICLFLYFCLFCLFVSLSLCLFVFLSFLSFRLFCLFCLFVFFCLCLFVFLSGHHSDQMSGGSWVSKVIICVEISKVAVTQSLTKVRYRAARAAKDWDSTFFH